MKEQVITGEETTPAAGEQETEVDLFSESETGEETAAAEQGTQTEQPQEQFTDTRTEQAFAKRLAAEREKIRRELEAEFKPQPKQTPQEDPDKVVEKLADDLMITPEAARVILQQQMTLDQMRSSMGDIHDRASKAEAKMVIEQQRKTNQHLPAFDESKLAAVRKDYFDRYGTVLAWEDTYRHYVAQEAMSGNLFTAAAHQAEQRAIANISGRNNATVQAGKGGSAKRATDVWGMPDQDFAKLVEDAKQGKFKKS